MDGEITIGTKLSTDKFDRQIANLEKKMKKEEDKGIVIGAKLSNQEQELEQARQKTDELADAYQRLKQAQDKLATGRATPMDFSTAQNLQNTFGSLEQIGTNFDRALTKQDQLEAKVENTRLQYNAINDKVSEYKQKIETIKIDKHASDVKKMQSGFTSVGNSVEQVTKKISRVILSIFGIRSALMIIRRASSDLANYDQDYANKLEYIRYVLAQAIAPVLHYIVNLAMTLLSYINAIAQAWFGVNLFANGSAENFKKMKAGAGGVSKAVKEIKKQLAGFDEVNVLSADSDSGTSPGAGGVGIGNLPDLSKIQGKVPEWMQWILDHKDEILSALAGIAAAIVAMKLANLLKALGLIGNSLSAIKAIGIGLMVSSLVYGIKSLIKYLKNPSWQNFGKVLQAIAGFILGLGLAIGNLPVALVGAVALMTATVIKYWDDIQRFLQSKIDWLVSKTDWVRDHLGEVGVAIYNRFIFILQNTLNWLNAFFTSIKQIFDGIIQFIRGVFTGNWQQAFDGLKNIAAGAFNIMVNTIIYIFNNLVNQISTKINIIKGFFQGAVNVIMGWFNKMGVSIPNAIAAKFKSIINSVLSAIENILNKPIGAINSLISQVNKLPGVRIGKLNNVKFGRLAVGGIVNMPNRGRLIGGQALAGESGAEGVIPLTDAQAMSTLGEAIGRYITINATIENRMNGKILSREIKQIRNNQDFAYNV